MTTDPIDADEVLSDIDTAYAVIDMAAEEWAQEFYSRCLRFDHEEEVQDALEIHRDLAILKKAREIIAEALDPRVVPDDQAADS